MANLTTKNTIETIPSYEVAEMMEKPHKDVLAMIHGNSQRDGIIQVLAELQMYPSDYFIESTYVDGSGKENRCYECTKMGCDMLANKMTGKKGIAFTAKYVKAFNDMQKAITNYEKASSYKYDMASYKLGEIYENGKGEISKNFKLAEKYYRLATEQGNEEAKDKLKLFQ
jgi:Rha family phage regulatory protein